VKAGAVEALIRKSVQRHFRGVYLSESACPEAGKPAILIANHHYWWDGYLGFLLIRSWCRQMVVWMEAFRRFPPFEAIGALPFPTDNPHRRAKTIRATVQSLNTSDRVLLLYPEGTLNPNPNELMPFQRSLHWLACRFPQVPILPLAIHIEPTYYQYPRVFLAVGERLSLDTADEQEFLRSARQLLQEHLLRLREQVAHLPAENDLQAHGFHTLLRGKLSIHEQPWARLTE